MAEYFAHNIPLTMPSYMSESNRAKWNDVALTVDNRMWLLQEALNLSGMRGEDFSAAVAALFDKNAEHPLLDDLTPQELSQIAQLHFKVTGSQPDRMEWPNCEVVVDTQFTTTKEWEMLRCIGIGGSEAAVIMEVSPYQTMQSLYHLKVGTPMKWEPEDSGKEFIFSYGHHVEDLVIETFCKRTGARVLKETRMFRHKAYPWITANVDAIVQMPPSPGYPVGRIYLFEAKTTTAFNKEAWFQNKVPAHYIPQCRQYLAVLNDPRISGTYIGCIYGNTPNDFVAKLVERDMSIEQVQLQEINAFWSNHSQRRREPAPSGKPKLDETLLKRINGPADPQAPKLQLGSSYTNDLREIVELNARLSDMNRQVKKLTESRDALLLPIKQAMGNHTKATVSGSNGMDYFITWSPIKRTNTDLEKLNLLYPEVYQDVVSVNPESSRKFSVKASVRS